MYTAKEKQAIRAAVQTDQVTFKKDGTVEFKRSYFYRSGMTAESWTTRVTTQLFGHGYTVSDIEAHDKWAAWPKTSYFVATMKVTKKG